MNNQNATTARPNTPSRRTAYPPPIVKAVQFRVEDGYLDSVVVSETLFDHRTYEENAFAPSRYGDFETLGDIYSYGDSHFDDVQ